MAKLRSLLRTSAGLLRFLYLELASSGLAMLGFSLAVSAACYLIAEKHSVDAGISVFSIPLGTCLGIGVVGAISRATRFSVRIVVKRLQLGRRAFELIFDRMLGVTESAQAGERGGAAAKVLERVPLAQAEERLRRIVSSLLDAEGKRGFFRKRLHKELLSQIEKWTLARFRTEGAAHGGVDLMKIKALLQAELDQLLASVLVSAQRKVAVVVLLIAGGGSFYLAILLRLSAG